MSTAPLPAQIDIRKLVVKGAEIKALEPVSGLPRVRDLLAQDSGSINVEMQFYYNEERFRCVAGHLTGEVFMTCQRCLEPMAVAVDNQFELGIVWSEDDAQRLPSSLDPLIVGEELVDLADIVSEELILSLPFVSYHQEQDCKQVVGFTSGDSSALATEDARSTRENPFQVLENLKLGK